MNVQEYILENGIKWEKGNMVRFYLNDKSFLDNDKNDSFKVKSIKKCKVWIDVNDNNSVHCDVGIVRTMLRSVGDEDIEVTK